RALTWGEECNLTLASEGRIANMSNGQMQGERNTAAFVLSLLAGLWMLSAGGMMGFGGGMMGGSNGVARYHHMMGGWMWGSGMHAFGMGSRIWEGINREA